MQTHAVTEVDASAPEGTPLSPALCQALGVPQGTVWGLPSGQRAKAAAAAPKTYTTIQYIAFEICTMPMGFDKQTSSADTTTPEWYPGLDSADADLAARVGIVARALARLDGHPSVAASPTCLKLLMMPEFFFRGKRGAYTVGEVLGDHRSTGSLSAQLASLVTDGGPTPGGPTGPSSSAPSSGTSRPPRGSPRRGRRRRRRKTPRGPPRTCKTSPWCSRGAA